jgi:methylenetetrahydrofolate reductase (NADPH)
LKVSDLYKEGRKTLSFEIFPPKKDKALEAIDETLDVLCELKPDFISVTFGAGGSVGSNNTIEIAKKIKHKYGVEPVVHLTSLHYDKNEIDEFAATLKNEGIENILALRGDRNANIPEKDDFHYASDVISYMKDKYDFCVLGACYPEMHPETATEEDELNNLKTKVDSGAEVLLSQLFFDNDKFMSFREKSKAKGIEVPMIPGVMPVINAAQIKRMLTMCNATFPERFKKITEKYENNKEALFDAGMSYALSQVIDLLVSDIDGIHLYTMNNPVVARRICEGIKNII